ncbi:ceramide synthase 6 [Neocloeon triangulifer]|uniref:ceramide synthase 6 n=1 Tax=Neocloeon triangulifer TaxID=2078957 RepID=UPI00286F038D|nr:ceramide synthase 6 [Neocloeon triangulifer]
MDFLRAVSDRFWSKHVWLPPNATWADVSKNDEVQHTIPTDLIYPIPMALLVLVIRFVCERYIFAPLGVALGLKSTKTKRAPPNAVLEKAYIKMKGPNMHKMIQGLSKQLDISERQIERWLRLRKAQDRPTTLVKFCESSWRCLYYAISFSYGFYILKDKVWFKDINHCWYNYPHQNLTRDVWWYYMMNMAFYWSLTISQFFDIKRKDFWQMFVHHIATLMLMSFSWVCNLFRIGSLVIVVHDIADIFLDGAKALKYANYQRTCDCVFAVFTCVWIISRIIVYPLWIIKATSIEAPTIVEMFPAYYIFNSLLLLLLVLHIGWTYLILRIVQNSIMAGQMDGDVRSSSSEDLPSALSEDDAAKVSNQNGTPKKNGKAN